MTYKIVKQNGIMISKTLLSSDTYHALERIIKTGSKKIQEVNAQTQEEKQNENELNPELLETIKELD